MTETAKPLPDVHDPVHAPYWAAARERRLVVPRCARCGHQLWPPEAACPVCLHRTFVWDEVAAEGTLWSFAIYHRALDPAFAADIPYAVGLVELAGGHKMYGIMRGDLDDLEVGEPVHAIFEPVTDEVTFVLWQVAR